MTHDDGHRPGEPGGPEPEPFERVPRTDGPEKRIQVTPPPTPTPTPEPTPTPTPG